VHYSYRTRLLFHLEAHVYSALLTMRFCWYYLCKLGLSCGKPPVLRCLPSKSHQRADEEMPVSLTVLHGRAMGLISISMLSLPEKRARRFSGINRQKGGSHARRSRERVWQVVARLFWRRQRRLRGTGKTGKLHLYDLRFCCIKTTRQPLFSHAVPKMRRADGPQIRKWTMTDHIKHE